MYIAHRIRHAPIPRKRHVSRTRIQRRSLQCVYVRVRVCVCACVCVGVGDAIDVEIERAGVGRRCRVDVDAVVYEAD